MSTTDTGKKQTSFLLTYALQSFGLILLLAVLIRTFLLSSYVMSGASMLPSIWPGEFLIGGRWQLGETRRGAVVVLRCPSAREHLCLKRVIGVAGDRIEFIKGHLAVNGQVVRVAALGSPFVQETVDKDSWPIWPADSNLNKPALIVPPQYVYLLNDKRSDPEDSRTWGPLPVAVLEARALLIWLSLDWFERAGPVRSWPRLRWERMFRSIN